MRWPIRPARTGWCAAVGPLRPGAGAGLGRTGCRRTIWKVALPMLEAQPPQFPFVACWCRWLYAACSRGWHWPIRAACESVDDAAGEAFDKTAKPMGLRYPGGPESPVWPSRALRDASFFPRPMTDRPGLISFQRSEDSPSIPGSSAQRGRRIRADPLRHRAGVPAAVVETLTIKCRQPLGRRAQSLVIAGGSALISSAPVAGADAR
ncbi:hypothetical protein [Stutzerimonas xanthomarina]|uniref:hypothetical protein n=1 Tax=Stutzerimonas xanthomarina TaxID=271420 RepID=UPI003AA9924B